MMKNKHVDLSILQQEYDSGSPLIEELRHLIQTIIDGKKLGVSEAESLQFPILVEKSWLIKSHPAAAGADFAIGHHSMVYYAIYRAFIADKVEPNFTHVKATVDFVQSVWRHFDPHGQHPRMPLIQGFMAFCLVSCEDPFSVEREQEVAQMPKGDPIAITYFLVYFDNADFATMTFDRLWQSLQIYTRIAGYPHLEGNNQLWQPVGNMLGQFFKGRTTDIDLAKQICIPLLATHGSGMIAAMVLQAMREQGQFSTDEVMALFRQPAMRWIAAAWLISEPIDQPAYITEIKEAVADLRPESPNYISAVIVVIHLDAHAPESDTELLAFCAAFIRSALHSRQTAIVKNTIFMMGVEKSTQQRYTHMLIELLQSEQWDSEYWGSMNLFFTATHQIDHFITFIKACCEKEGTQFKVGHWGGALAGFHMNDPAATESAIIGLMTHQSGPVRFAGLKLMFHLFNFHKVQRLTFNLLELPYAQQYRFVVTASQDVTSAEPIVRMLAPLLASPCEQVWEQVVSQLQGLILDFKYAVLPLVENEITHLPDQAAIMDRLQAYWDRFYEGSSLQHGVKELDSRITYPELHKKYMQYFIEANSQIQEDLPRKRHPVWSYVKPVSVARGGGSIHPDGTIHPFQTISTSFTLPRTSYIIPEVSIKQKYDFFNNDWILSDQPWTQVK